jgi:hypothetical protein
MSLKFLRFDPESLMARFLLLADGEGGEGGEGGGGDGAAAAAATAAAAEAAKGGAGDAAKWREAFTDPEARKFAENSPDINHFAGRALDMRRQLSTAIIPPGKDAKPEEVAAYRKKLGVPDKAEDYLFEDDKDYVPTEVDKAMRGRMAKVFHERNVPAETAKALSAEFKAMTADTAAAIKQADENYAKESDAALRSKWGADYEANKTFAGRAAKELFGEAYETVKGMTDKGDRFIFDNPVMMEAFAKLGREMGESRLGSVLSDTDKASIDDRITELRKLQTAATSAGDSRKANTLYQEEQALIAKRDGNKGIVGDQGRAA